MRGGSIISTEGRVFIAQLTRDLAARERAGAALLSPGATCWIEAFESFGASLRQSAGPIRAAEKIKAAVARLREAQRQGACFVNGTAAGRKRTAAFEVLTWTVAKHPLVDSGRDGVIVHRVLFVLRRTGRLVGGSRDLAFLSWHALGRMRERSEADLFAGRGIVAMCGLAGALMRASPRHSDSELNLAFSSDATCTGLLRDGFFDVLTVLQRANDRRWLQAEAVLAAIHDYLKSDSSNPSGYADKIAVLPARDTDYVSRELRSR